MTRKSVRRAKEARRLKPFQERPPVVVSGRVYSNREAIIGFIGAASAFVLVAVLAIVGSCS